MMLRLLPQSPPQLLHGRLMAREAATPTTPKEIGVKRCQAFATLAAPAAKNPPPNSKPLAWNRTSKPKAWFLLSRTGPGSRWAGRRARHRGHPQPQPRARDRHGGAAPQKIAGAFSNQYSIIQTTQPPYPPFYSQLKNKK
jgi:hypothetical protein